MRSLGFVLAIAATLPATGCCNLARYFCGPDHSDWVSERYDTPDATIATFREAVRRADSQAIYRAMSEGFKQQTGLYSVEAELVWRRIQDQVPGAHVLGYAEVSESRLRGPDYVEVTLSISGRSLRIDLVRQPYWEIRWVYGDDPNDIEREGRYVQSVRGFGQLEVDEENFTVRPEVRLPALEVEIDDLDRVQSVGIGFEWKVNAIRELPEAGQGSDP